MDPRVHRRPRRLAARGGDRTRGAAGRADRDGRRPLLRHGPRQPGRAHGARGGGDPDGEGTAGGGPDRRLSATKLRGGITDEFIEPIVCRRVPAPRARRRHGDLLQLPPRPRPPALPAAAGGRGRPDDDDAVRRGHRHARSAFPEQEVRRDARRGAERRRPAPASRGRDGEVRPRHVLLQRRRGAGVGGRGAGARSLTAGRAELRPEAGDVGGGRRGRGRRRGFPAATRFCVVNFANPDMVGHTGVIPAVVRAVEAADAALGEGRARRRAPSAASASSPPTTATPRSCSSRTASARTRPTRRARCRSSSPPQAPVCAKSGGLADLAPTVLDLLGIPIPEGDDRESARRLLGRRRRLRTARRIADISATR